MREHINVDKRLGITPSASLSSVIELYRGMVFATALREIHDYCLAEDITQSVFLLLARKHLTIPTSSLSSWLFHASRLTARNALRKENRRKQVEENMLIQVMQLAEEREPSRVSGLINDALNELKHEELRLVMLRFYEGLTLSEVGLTLGISEEAARKRVNRTLNRLRLHFSQAGIDCTLIQTKGIVRTMITETDAIHEIDAMYSRMDRIYASKDTPAVRSLLEEIYTPEFHIIEMNGQRRDKTREELIESISTGIAARPPEKSRVHEVELISLEGNIAVVATKLTIIHLTEMRPVYRLAIQDRWIKSGNEWRFDKSCVQSAVWSDD